MGPVNAKKAAGRRAPRASLAAAAALAAALSTALGGCDGQQEDIRASGVIESDMVSVKAPGAGRIQTVGVELGQDVAAGAVLLAMDSSLAEAQIDEAKAGVDAARAKLDQLRSGARPEEQAVADAQLALAMAQWDLARRIWQAAAAAPSSAQLTADALAGGAPQGATGVAAGGGVGQLQASATASAAQTASESRAVGQADPQAAYLQAEVAAQAAQVAAEDLREGPGDAALRQTEADVRQAESALAAVQANRRRLDLTSPIHGRVMEVLVSPGDLTVGGATLLRLTDPTTATLTVYVSEADMADLEVGDAVDVTVKAYPGDTFKGTIGAIAQEAEFTPRSVQTEDQRAMLVFAVRVDLENPKGRLKSGMPAEATFTGR